MNKYDYKRGEVYKSIGVILRWLRRKEKEFDDNSCVLVKKDELLKMLERADSSWHRLGEMKQESITADVAKLRQIFKKRGYYPSGKNNAYHMCAIANEFKVQPEAVLRYIIESEEQI